MPLACAAGRVPLDLLSAGRLIGTVSRREEPPPLPEGREKLPPPEGRDSPVDLPEIEEPLLPEGRETLDLLVEGLETEWPPAL